MTLSSGNGNGGKPPTPVGPDLDILVKRLQSRVSSNQQLEALKPQVNHQVEALKPAATGATPTTGSPFSILQRLERKFGLGDQPGTRRRLYQRLQTIVEQHGEMALKVISETVAESGHARKPDRWFVRSVKLRLQEAGMWAQTPVDW